MGGVGLVADMSGRNNMEQDFYIHAAWVKTYFTLTRLIYTDHELMMKSNAYTNLAVISIWAFIFFSSGLHIEQLQGEL